MTRVLIAARKWNKVACKTGDGIGLDTQDTLAREFCERNGYEVAGVARDTISGTLAPMDRKELGQWVTDPVKLSQYDAIVFYAVDRISRGADEVPDSCPEGRQQGVLLPLHRQGCPAAWLRQHGPPGCRNHPTSEERLSSDH